MDYEREVRAQMLRAKDVLLAIAAAAGGAALPAIIWKPTEWSVRTSWIEWVPVTVAFIAGSMLTTLLTRRLRESWVRDLNDRLEEETAAARTAAGHATARKDLTNMLTVPMLDVYRGAAMERGDAGMEISFSFEIVGATRAWYDFTLLEVELEIYVTDAIAIRGRQTADDARGIRVHRSAVGRATTSVRIPFSPQDRRNLALARARAERGSTPYHPRGSILARLQGLTKLGPDEASHELMAVVTPIPGCVFNVHNPLEDEPT